MSAANVEVVRRMQELYNRGDGEAALAFYDPAIEWEAGEVFGHRTYRGHDGLRELFRDWLGTWESYTAEIDELVDAASDKVVLVLRQTARGRGSGTPVENRTFVVHTVRDGLIVRTRVFETRAEAIAAAGGEPE